MRLKGRGDYVVDGPVPSRHGGISGWGGNSWGHHIGSFFGGSAGGRFGDSVHRGIKYLTGFGDYRSANHTLTKSMEKHHEKRGLPPHDVSHVMDSSLLEHWSSLTPTVPTFISTADGVEFVSHERIGVVLSSTNFASTHYSFNPGLASVFPWLSGMAAGFQQWDAVQAVVCYIPVVVPPTSTTGAAGNVYIAATYDVTRKDMSSTAQMDDSEYTTNATPDKPLYHGIECARKRTAVDLLRIRAGPPASNSDLGLSDPCYFQVATEGMGTAGVLLGHVYMTYRIRLLKPALTTGNNTSASFLQVRSYVNSTANVIDNNPWAAAALDPALNARPAATLPYLPLILPNPVKPTLNGTLAIDLFGWPVGSYTLQYTVESQIGTLVTLWGSNLGGFSNLDSAMYWTSYASYGSFPTYATFGSDDLIGGHNKPSVPYGATPITSIACSGNDGASAPRAQTVLTITTAVPVPGMIYIAAVANNLVSSFSMTNTHLITVNGLVKPLLASSEYTEGQQATRLRLLEERCVELSKLVPGASSLPAFVGTMLPDIPEIVMPVYPQLGPAPSTTRSSSPIHVEAEYGDQAYEYSVPQHFSLPRTGTHPQALPMSSPLLSRTRPL